MFCLWVLCRKAHILAGCMHKAMCVHRERDVFQGSAATMQAHIYPMCLDKKMYPEEIDLENVISWTFIMSGVYVWQQGKRIQQSETKWIWPVDFFCVSGWNKIAWNDHVQTYNLQHTRKILTKFSIGMREEICSQLDETGLFLSHSSISSTGSKCV